MDFFKLLILVIALNVVMIGANYIDFNNSNTLDFDNLKSGGNAFAGNSTYNYAQDVVDYDSASSPDDDNFESNFGRKAQSQQDTKILMDESGASLAGQSNNLDLSSRNENDIIKMMAWVVYLIDGLLLAFLGIKFFNLIFHGKE